MAGDRPEMLGLDQSDLSSPPRPRIAVAYNTARNIEIRALNLNERFAAARPDAEPHNLSRSERDVQKLRE